MHSDGRQFHMHGIRSIKTAQHRGRNSSKGLRDDPYVRNVSVTGRPEECKGTGRFLQAESKVALLSAKTHGRQTNTLKVWSRNQGTILGVGVSGAPPMFLSVVSEQDAEREMSRLKER